MTDTVTKPANATYTQWADGATHTDVTIQNRGDEAVEIVITAALANASDTGYLINAGDERQFSGFTGIISGRAPFGSHSSIVVLLRS
ncbi:hypothetical protein [Neptunomonas japonica]|uniref:hypothetical protein n=1 Tax=Neptunomonas japonica TaxID=417574 RepID=UPI00041836E4|nr:hypothetical protein [Neptunomonas japonica]